MSNIILTPIDQLTASTSIVQYLRRVLNNAIRKYGATYHREKIIKTLNERGTVIDLSRNIAPLNLMLFDRMNSDFLTSMGISTTETIGASKKESPRAYIVHDASIDEGDFVLMNYDEDDDTWDERYRVLEKESHELSGNIIFYTIYLRKEPDGVNDFDYAGMESL